MIQYLFEGLNSIGNIQILGPSPKQDPHRGALATFHIKNIHSNDIAEILDANGICIRSGHHCCQPLHKHYNLSSSARASLSFTTTQKEIDLFIEELNSTISFLRKNS